jgi:hypothetical protein
LIARKFLNDVGNGEGRKGELTELKNFRRRRKRLMMKETVKAKGET